MKSGDAPLSACRTRSVRIVPGGTATRTMITETSQPICPLRVVELTGEPGDMVFCHPLMVHCSTQNRGTRPRFIRIKQQLLTPEGRQLLRMLTHPRW